MLRRGTRGEDVRWLQRRLQVHGANPGPADGVFGRWTDNAVREFQQQQGLDIDGLAGPDTIHALARPPD
jgi:peptidoglycan hydrolase-like protein with peptidoglycan-binding domain